MSKLEKGQIVVSKAGRDKGKFLIVLSYDNNGVFVIDGKERPIERPKKKSPKHIYATKQCLSEKDFATNRAARKSLRTAAEKMKF